MKHFILSASVAASVIFGVSACATGPTAYGPASSGGGGYKNTQIENDRFRVSYTGRTEDEARDYVLLRAAEIAKAEGYSHFKIINGSASDNGPNSGIGSSLGIAIGSGGRRGSRTNVGLAVDVFDIVRAMEGRKVTESIEVLLINSPHGNSASGNSASGNSAKSKAQNIYDAKSITDNIRPAVFK